MKTILKLLALLILGSVPIFFATARPEVAPGIQKKSLQILGVSVATTESTATISWETNAPSSGSVTISDFGFIDEKTGTRHSVTIPYLTPGAPYTFVIHSYNDLYGAALPYAGSFTL